jgi:hypothetical protein
VTWFAIAVVLNAVSVVLYVLAVREHRRADRLRERAGLDRPLNASRVDDATARLRP